MWRSTALGHSNIKGQHVGMETADESDRLVPVGFAKSFEIVLQGGHNRHDLTKPRVIVANHQSGRFSRASHRRFTFSGKRCRSHVIVSL